MHEEAVLAALREAVLAQPRSLTSYPGFELFTPQQQCDVLAAFFADDEATRRWSFDQQQRIYSGLNVNDERRKESWLSIVKRFGSYTLGNNTIGVDQVVLSDPRRHVNYVMSSLCFNAIANHMNDLTVQHAHLWHKENN